MAREHYKDDPTGPSPQKVCYHRRLFREADEALREEEEGWESLDTAVRLALQNNPEDIVVGQERFASMLDVVGLLGDDAAEIFMGFYVEDKPLKEIAHSTGHTPDFVHRRVGHIRARLRYLLTREGDPDDVLSGTLTGIEY